MHLKTIFLIYAFQLLKYSFSILIITYVSTLQTSIAFTSLVVVAIPTLLVSEHILVMLSMHKIQTFLYFFLFHIIQALKRTAKSLAKLADTACMELPSTMAAIRLSGLEISDLTVELSDLRYSFSRSFIFYFSCTLALFVIDISSKF